MKIIMWRNNEKCNGIIINVKIMKERKWRFNERNNENNENNEK